MRAGKRSRRHRSVEDGRFEGASPRPGKRADIAKNLGTRQRRKASNPSITNRPERKSAENLAAQCSDKRHRPYSLRPRTGRLPILAASKNEGMERRVAHQLTPCEGVARLAIGTLAIRRSTCGDFCPRDRIFRVRDRERCPPSSGRLPPAFVGTASSH